MTSNEKGAQESSMRFKRIIIQAAVDRLKDPCRNNPKPSSRVHLVAYRHVSASGVVLTCGQKIALICAHAGQTVALHVSDTTLAIEVDDADTPRGAPALGHASP
jgi:hypothetical protein